MRRALDALYAASGVLGAVFLALIALTVLVQVGFNIVDRLAALVTGRPIGLVLPSYAEFTGYFLAASTFFAAAHTLARGAHIRVTLVLLRLPAGARRVAEVWCAGIGLVFAAYFTWASIGLVRDSLTYGDVSPGMVAVPLWLVQAPLALGLAALTIALADRLVGALLGHVAEDA